MSQSLRLRQLIKSASKGAGSQALQALRDIADLLQSDLGANSTILIEVWPVLQTHLQASRIPQNQDEAEAPLPVQLAHGSLRVLALGLDHQFTKFAQRFLDAWKSSIWPWTLLFVNEVIGNSCRFDPEATLKMVISVCGAVTMKARKSVFVKELRKTPDYIRTIVRLWFHCARNLPSVMHDILTIVTGLLPDTPIDRQGEGMEIVMELEKYPLADSSSLILDTIIVAVESDQICAETLCWSMDLFIGFTISLRDFPVIAQSLLVRGSIPVVILVLSQIAALDLSHLPSLDTPVVPLVDIQNLLGAIDACFTHLLHVFENVRSYTPHAQKEDFIRSERVQWVAQALDHKLLNVLRRLVMFLKKVGFDRGGHDKVYVSWHLEQLYISLGKYVSHDTICRLLARSFAMMAPFPEEPLILVQPWQDFKKLADLGLTSWADFVSEPQSICSAPDCPSKKVYVTRSAPCAGCNVAFYCSRACQKKHWVSGHKNYCAVLRSRPRAHGYPGAMTSIDKAFEGWLLPVMKWYSSHSQHVKPKRKHPQFVEPQHEVVHTDTPTATILPSDTTASHVEEPVPLSVDTTEPSIEDTEAEISSSSIDTTGPVTPISSPKTTSAIPPSSQETKQSNNFWKPSGLSWADMVDDEDFDDIPLPEFPPLSFSSKANSQINTPPTLPLSTKARKSENDGSPHGEETSSLETTSTPKPAMPPKAMPRTTNTARASSVNGFQKSFTLSWADIAEEEFDDSVRMFS